MYKIGVYIPLEAAAEVKSAMFSAGAGKIGNYDSCCFEYEGIGQFRPLDGSRPHVGEHGQIQKVKELRVEMVVEDQLIKDVIAAMKCVHPYETVAYDVVKLESL